MTLGVNIANFANSRQGSAGVGDWFLYLLAPLVGAALATAIFRLTRHSEYVATPKDKSIKNEVP